MIDTGAQSCLILAKLVPVKYHKKLDRSLNIRTYDGSTHLITHCINNIPISFNQITFTLPQTLIIPLENTSNFIIGLNFLINIGGFQLLGNEITFFKQSISYVKKPTSECALERGGLDNTKKHILEKQIDQIEEVEEIPVEVIHTKDILCFNIPKIQIYRIEKSLEQLIDEATNKRIIGENPLEHWDKNKLYAHLEIINKDIRIIAPDIKYTPLDIEDFKHHLEKLNKLKIIKPSTSKHKSAAMIVRNHAEIARGESRMVFNYKRLNDNTVDDSYKIPDKDMLLNKIQGANIFSKFDLKSGFWQIKLHPDSIPWCAFTTPFGHFDWLVMPFGIKNAPSIFQRKMDTIFNNVYNFTCVYIDDILVFSKNLQEHRKHLSILFKIFIEEGLIISQKKMKLEQPKIDFLGLEIEREGKIKLQPHIAKKLLDFPNDLSETKTLQQFLGVLNYTRTFYKNLSQDTQPLYNKLKKSGQKHFNKEDKALIDRTVT